MKEPTNDGNQYDPTTGEWIDPVPERNYNVKPVDHLCIYCGKTNPNHFGRGAWCTKAGWSGADPNGKQFRAALPERAPEGGTTTERDAPTRITVNERLIGGGVRDVKLRTSRVMLSSEQEEAGCWICPCGVVQMVWNLCGVCGHVRPESAVAASPREAGGETTYPEGQSAEVHAYPCDNETCGMCSAELRARKAHRAAPSAEGPRARLFCSACGDWSLTHAVGEKHGHPCGRGVFGPHVGCLGCDLCEGSLAAALANFPDSDPLWLNLGAGYYA